MFYKSDTITERVKRDVQSMLGNPPLSEVVEFLDELDRQGYTLVPPYEVTP